MKRKKTIRNIIIAVVIAVLIVAAVILTIVLRKDGRGMNSFERAHIAATADGESVTMLEYAMILDNALQSYSNSTLTDEQLKELQENAAAQALLEKIYVKEAKALGLTLTDEEEKAIADSAQQQIDAIVEGYTESLVNSGSFSKAALDKQIASYYAAIGMNQSQYYAYCKERLEASYYGQKLDEYYDENGAGFTEEEILESYHSAVDEMKEQYQVGQYSTYQIMYAYGYTTPLLYVPEGFFYVDVIEVEKTTEQEVRDVLNKVILGGKEDESLFVLPESYDKPDGPALTDGMTFDELRDSEDNTFLYSKQLTAPYAIGDDDYGYVFGTGAEAYEAAKALEIGQIGVSIVPQKQTDTDGNELVTGYTGYLFRRAEGTMCEDGQTGTVKIDFYPSIRESVVSGLLQDKWLNDVVHTDEMYAYRGTVG